MEQVIRMVEGGGDKGGGHITTPAETFGHFSTPFYGPHLRGGVGRFFSFSKGGGRRWTVLLGGHLSGAFVFFPFFPLHPLLRHYTAAYKIPLLLDTSHHLHLTPTYLPLGHTLNTNLVAP